MSNINWFCDLMGIDLRWYQKALLNVRAGNQIRRARMMIDKMWGNQCDKYSNNRI